MKNDWFVEDIFIIGLILIMAKNEVCTKEDLIEIRRQSDSYLNNKNLVNDVFQLITKFVFHQRVISLEEFDPSKIFLEVNPSRRDRSCTMLYSGEPLLVQLPEIKISTVNLQSQKDNKINIDIPEDYSQKLQKQLQDIDTRMSELFQNRINPFNNNYFNSDYLDNPPDDDSDTDTV